MASTVWVNGRFVEGEAARVSAMDAGLQHGVGLFETMTGAGGRIFRLAEHMARLETSSRELGLSESLRVRALGEAAEAVLARSGLAEGAGRARVRLTVTGGDLNLLQRGEGAPVDPTIVIHAQPATTYPSEMFERGVSVLIAEPKANPLNPFEGHKTLDYWWRLRTLQQAARAGAGEALVLQVTNHVAGGAVSNLFAVRGGSLVTPLARGEEGGEAVPSPVLPGITRGAVVELAERRGLGVERRLVTVADVLDAEEVFLTNASWGVLPVTRVEQKAIGSGAPGEVTTGLREAWLEAVRAEV